MRFFYTVAAALLAAVVSAQNNAISIPEGQSTLEVTAGAPLTLEWTNPSSGTVTIKLQQDPITPNGGITLASGIPASDLGATVQIPDAADVNTFQYTIEIIDDTNSANYNFSPNFGIKGATGTSTGTAATASATGSTQTGSSTASASSSETTESSAATTSDSSSSTDSSSSSAATSTESSETTSSSSSSSSATSSESAAATTSVASSNNNGASGLQVQGGLLAMAVGLIAVM